MVLAKKICEIGYFGTIIIFLNFKTQWLVNLNESVLTDLYESILNDNKYISKEHLLKTQISVLTVKFNIKYVKIIIQNQYCDLTF